MAWLTFLVLVIVYPGIFAFASAPRWAVMGVGVALLLCVTRIRLTKAHWPVVALLSWAAVSLIYTPVFYDGANAFIQLALMGFTFVLAMEQGDLTKVYEAAGWGVIVSGVIACFQVFGISPVQQLAAPAGLFANKNLMGETAAVVLVLLVMSRKWYLVPGVAVTLLLSQCRGAWLGAMVALLFWLWPRYRKVSIAGFALIAFGLIAMLFTPVQQTLHMRWVIWHDALAQLTVMGNGIGSYHVLGDIAGHQVTEGIRSWHAHNDLLELTFELGVIGIAAVLGIGWFVWRGPECERLALVALCTASMFGFPFHCPATAFLGALLAGRACAQLSRVWLGMDVGRNHSFAGIRHRSKSEYPDRRPRRSGTLFPVGF